MSRLCRFAMPAKAPSAGTTFTNHGPSEPPSRSIRWRRSAASVYGHTTSTAPSCGQHRISSTSEATDGNGSRAKRSCGQFAASVADSERRQRRREEVGPNDRRQDADATCRRRSVVSRAMMSAASGPTASRGR